MNAHNTAPIGPEAELDRNIRLIQAHGEALERVRSLEEQLRQVDLDERLEIERYAQGFSNDAPISRDEDRQRLATLLAGARPAARTARD